jgi:hypothetical protein
MHIWLDLLHVFFYETSQPKLFLCEIWGFYGVQYEDYCHLERDNV